MRATTALALLLSPLSLVLAYPSTLTSRQMTPPSLPYPRPFNPGSCPTNTTNLFGDSGFVPAPASSDASDLTGRAMLPSVAPRTFVETACQQLAGFRFPPLNGPTAATAPVQLAPGVTYVFSVAADAAVSKIVAWSLLPNDRFRRSQFVASSRPGQNSGTLEFTVNALAQVWFVVVMGQAQATGEVGLFGVGVEQ